MTGKLCIKCKIEKPTREFSRSKSKRDGLQSNCKDCCKIAHKVYQEANKAKIAQQMKTYYNENKTKIAEYQKAYYSNNKTAIAEQKKAWREANKKHVQQQMKTYHNENKAKIAARNKTWREANKERLKQTRKTWYQSNKAKHAEQMKAYSKAKKQQDPIYKLKCSLSSLIGAVFNTRYKYGKKTRTYQLLGADYETVFNHLIETARINYGFWLAELDYHIDHIIPCSTAKTEKELIALQHYKNLQLLRPCDNLAKSDKLDWLSPYMRSIKHGPNNYSSAEHYRNTFRN